MHFYINEAQPVLVFFNLFIQYDTSENVRDL